MGDETLGGRDDLRALLDGTADERPGGRISFRQRNGHAFLILRNEFATVHVSVDHRPSGVRLVVTDPEGGTSVGLDPLELEAISRMRHDDFDERILERAPMPESRLDDGTA